MFFLRTSNDRIRRTLVGLNILTYCIIAIHLLQNGTTPDYSRTYAFAEKPVKEIPEELEKLLTSIATTGQATYPWSKVKLLLVQKLDNVIEEYLKDNPDESVPLLPNVENVPFVDMKQRLLTNINKFRNAPFTIQRICELLVSPKKYYMQRDKFLRGIEKNILIVTTVTPKGKRITTVSNGPPMVNGIFPPENIPNGTPPRDTQFKVPSSPGDVRQQPSSSGAPTIRDSSHIETSGEPAPKRIRLQDLPDQSKESPSTSDDRLPPSETDVPSNDGVSSIDDAKSSVDLGSNVDVALTDVSSNETVSVDSGADSDRGDIPDGGTCSNETVSSGETAVSNDNVFSNGDCISSNNVAVSNNGVSSNGDIDSSNDVPPISKTDISDQNGVSSNKDISADGDTAPHISSNDDINTDVSEGVSVQEGENSGESRISNNDVSDSTGLAVSDSTGLAASDSTSLDASGTPSSNSGCELGSQSSSSEAMETDQTTQRLEDQSSSLEVQTGVESSSEVSRSQEVMEEGSINSGTDAEMDSGTEDVRGQSSEEEMEAQSSTQVTESPAPEEDTNEAVAAKPSQEEAGGE